MKSKTIKAVLNKKFNDFLTSIPDEELRKEIKNGSIITGGAIPSMLLQEPVNDYDVYFTTHDLALRVAQYYVKLFNETKSPAIPLYVENKDNRVKIIAKSAGIISENDQGTYQYFETIAEAQNYKIAEYVDTVMGLEKPADVDTKPAYRPVFMSCNAITLSDKMQLVIRFTGEPDEIHKNYDFVHCTNYWTSKNNHLELRKEALEAILTKELLYTGSLYPVCSVIRTRKFLHRGWTINAGQYLKMCMQISQLDLTDFNILSEQLVGVDTAYFCELLDKLQINNPEKVNYIYLMEIIDRLF